MEKLEFIHIDPEQIKSDLKAEYESLSGRTVQPGQVEQLLLNVFAYREYLLKVQINEAANLNLIDYSRAPFLDDLGQLVGIRRLLSSPAVCTVKLTFTPGHGNLSIPAGIRIQSVDGQVIFMTDAAVSVVAGTDEYTVSATAQIRGLAGNGYAPGAISVILDPQPYMESAENIEATIGGADDESDDDLRERIRLAPESFSNAGSEGAYKFFAMGANPGIADISITSPNPGEVVIYPLMKGGEIPNQTVLNEVEAACNAEWVRPLTDTVMVNAPSEITYTIEVTLTLLTGSVAQDVTDRVTAVLQEYADSRNSRIGLDVVREAIIRGCMQENVYSVDVTQPVATIPIGADEVAKCTGIIINVGGYSDE